MFIREGFKCKQVNLNIVLLSTLVDGNWKPHTEGERNGVRLENGEGYPSSAQ